MSPRAQVEWLLGVTERVNAQLEQLLANKRADARAVSPHAEELVEAVTDLTMRGGKRLRPAAAYAALRAVGGESATMDDGWLALGASLEFLQTYFLIQDDWMDGDEQRRGGPAVHVALTRKHGSAQLGASLAMLAADLASGFAWEQLALAKFPPTRLQDALLAFAQMHGEVVYGQQLDLLQHPNIALVHQLKTGSYTVRGPLMLGALLGGASATQLTALQRFGEPLGLAFQLRDDLLGAFGNHRVVGKPVGIDLRAGKHTSLIAEVRSTLSPAERAQFNAAFGQSTANDEAIASAHAMIERSGARERLEARVTALTAEAMAALNGPTLDPTGVTLLANLASRLTDRDR